MKKAVSLVLALALLLCIAPSALAASESIQNFKKVNEYVTGQFSDVEKSAWYAENVKVAYELGLVKGSSTTAYNPNGNITIAESLALACRLHDIFGRFWSV